MTPPPSKRARLGSTPSISRSRNAGQTQDTGPPLSTRPSVSQSNANALIRTPGNTEKFMQVTSLSDNYRVKEMPLSELYYVPSFVSSSQAEDWYNGLLDLDSWYQPKLKIFGREVTQSRKIAAYSTDPSLILKYSGQTVDMRYTYPPLLRMIQDKVENLLEVQFNHVMLNLYEDGGVYIGNHRDNLENKVIASLSLGAPRTFIMTRDQKVKPPPTAQSNPPASLNSKSHSKMTANLSRKRPHEQALDEAHDVQETLEGALEGDEADRALTRVDDDSNADRRGSMECVDKKSWLLHPGSLVVMQGETQRYWKHQIPKEPQVKDGRISLTFRQLVSGVST